MDVNDLRTLVTLLSFACFIGIVVWACARRNQTRFDEAALVPFLHDEDHLPRTGGRHE